MAAWLQTLRSALPWLALIWSLLVGLLLLRLLASVAWLRREIRRARDVSADHLQGVGERFTAGQRVRVLESSAVTGPATAGWRHPVILIPRNGVLSLPVEQMQALTLHEVAHINRADFLAAFLRSIAFSFYGFHPAIRALYFGAEQSDEEAADEIAARLYGDPDGYAAALVALAEHDLNRRMMLSASGGSLRNRIVRVLAGPSHNARHARRNLAGSVAGGILAIGLIGYASGAAASEQGEVRWLMSHGLDEAIFRVVGEGGPRYQDLDRAMAMVIDQITTTETVSHMELDGLAEALLAAPLSNVMRDRIGDLDPRTLHSATLGSFGSYRDRRRIGRQLLENAEANGDERKRWHSAALLLAAIDAPVDDGAAAQVLLRRPGFIDGLGLSPAGAYELHVAWALDAERTLVESRSL